MAYPLPAGGRGYIRPASLVSVWSSAPFLQNNTVGPFDEDPSVPARMNRFDRAIRQLLWPETRDKDRIFGNENGPGVGVIDRLTADTYLDVPEGYVPDYLRPLIGASRLFFPFIGGRGGSVAIGPFPKGMPVGLITNVDMLGVDLSDADRRAHRRRVLQL